MSTEQIRKQVGDSTVVDRSLRDQTCVVTGASRGIGRAIAIELARNGSNVVINYASSESAAKEVAETITSVDEQAITAQADIGEYEDVLSMADRVHETFGPVDVLVNNAGVSIDRRFDRMTMEDWNRVIDVNLGGTFRCSKAFYEDIKAAAQGRIINVSSVIGRQGNYGQSNYAASKSGLIGFTRSIALELAPHDSTANCIAPGYTRTDMVQDVREDIQDSIREDIPFGRFASTEEIASTVRFLASKESSYITGEVLNVNGGMYG